MNKRFVIFIVAIIAIATLLSLVFFTNEFVGEAIKVRMMKSTLSKSTISPEKIMLPQTGVSGSPGEPTSGQTSAPMEGTTQEEVVSDEPDEPISDLSCLVVNFVEGYSGKTGNQLCSNEGKVCKWIMSVKENVYYDNLNLALDKPRCDGDIQVTNKEYSFSEHFCTDILQWQSLKDLRQNICSSMFGSKPSSGVDEGGWWSAEPRLGVKGSTPYIPYEVMCC